VCAIRGYRLAAQPAAHLCRQISPQAPILKSTFAAEMNDIEALPIFGGSSSETLIIFYVGRPSRYFQMAIFKVPKMNTIGLSTVQ
jgi:hypothetical protein